MGDLVIEVEDDAPPAVRGVAATLRRSASDRRLGPRVRRLKGVMALRSNHDHQAATIRFARGRVRVESGTAKDADVVVTLDFNAPSGPGAPKPHVKGALRHPVFALGAGKVLEPPTGPWKDEAARFWAFAKDASHMPDAVLVVCTDDGSDLVLANGDGAARPQYEIHGTARALASVFSGSSVIIEQMRAGRMRWAGSMEHATALTGRSIAWAMGEGR